MFEKAKPARDAFTFSLGGMTAAIPFAAVPVIADDRINRILDERRRQAHDKRASDQTPARETTIDTRPSQMRSQLSYALVTPYTMSPAIDGQRLNRMIDARLSKMQSDSLDSFVPDSAANESGDSPKASGDGDVGRAA